jgi:hypothetical protein
VAAQIYRVGGGIFLVLWADGRLPWQFALPAGIGDVVTGCFAVVVAVSLARLGRLGDRLKAQIRPLTHAAWLLGGSNKFALPPSRILNFRERTNATEPRRNLSSTRDSDYCDPPQRLSKESAGTVSCAPFIVLSLAGGGAALASCWGAGFGFTTAVCCGSLLGESFLGVYRLKGESFQLSKAAYLSAFGRLNGCRNCCSRARSDILGGPSIELLPDVIA